MKVLVFQSHAVTVPGWILRCTASVRDWAGQSGYSYRLIGDELFEGIPLQLALKAQSRLPLADLGRLLWSERLLETWDCVVWIDLDVLVFDPANFAIDTESPYLVCQEILVRRERGKKTPTIRVSYNPTVLMFRRGTPFLRHWIDEIWRHAERVEGLGDADFGREMLRRISPRGRSPAIRTVGHFNAAILKELFGHKGPAIDFMMRANSTAFAAANLCGHHNIPSEAYASIIDKLLVNAGAVVNDRPKASN